MSIDGERRKLWPLFTFQWKPLNVTIRKAQIMTHSIFKIKINKNIFQFPNLKNKKKSNKKNGNKLEKEGGGVGHLLTSTNIFPAHKQIQK